MAQFQYIARSKSGEKLSGTMSAASRAAAAEAIERMGLFPVAIEPARAATGEKSPGANTTKATLGEVVFGRMFFCDRKDILDIVLALVFGIMGVLVLRGLYVGQWLPSGTGRFWAAWATMVVFFSKPVSFFLCGGLFVVMIYGFFALMLWEAHLQARARHPHPIQAPKPTSEAAPFPMPKQLCQPRQLFVAHF